MYFWQPIAGSFYAPCVDGDYDQGVIGHEFGHMIENRMIGKGNARAGFHAGAMGEAFGDLVSIEYLRENSYTPTDGEDPFATGTYATGNKEHGIRNYVMNYPRTGAFPTPSTYPHVNPLNFSDIGYDTPGNEVHSDGEIWVAINNSVRQALIDKYNGAFPAGDAALQAQCAAGELPSQNCPGNRRWIQLVFDAMLLDPVAPTMIDARNSMLAADVMRYGGANQTEIWRAFAQRGLGQRAAGRCTPRHGRSDTRSGAGLRARRSSSNAAGDVRARRRRHRATRPSSATSTSATTRSRVIPIADTDPATTNSGIDVNRDADRILRPGRVRLPRRGEGLRLLPVQRRPERAVEDDQACGCRRTGPPRRQGATATGDGTGSATRSTRPRRPTGRPTAAPPTGRSPGSLGKQVTIDLAGTDARRRSRTSRSAR